MIDISDTSSISLWLIEYGSVALYVILSLGIIGLPLPEETLMIVAGMLMHRGKLNIPPTILFAYAGTITGITVSYLLGRTAGTFLIVRYGSWIGISEKHLLKAHYWFERLGKWVLSVGYFIPGIRHLTGFCAGTTGLKYSHFALYAYGGAIIWVSLFLSLGYFVGDYCLDLFDELTGIDRALIGLGIGFLCVLFFIIRKWFKRPSR